MGDAALIQEGAAVVTGWAARLHSARERHTGRMSQAQLFRTDPQGPAGFVYAPEFIDEMQQGELLELIRALPFEEAQYKQWRARRRIVSFGGRYDYSQNELGEAPPIPPFLYPLRAQLAHWAGLREERVQHATVAEYRPGTPLGWHRDVPEFEDVIGTSLLGHARMRFRPWPPASGQRATWKVDLEPRSAYQIRGPARWQWQHAVSPTRELRYSITFRTRNARGQVAHRRNG